MNETDFRRGYYLAVANLIRRWDDPTIAADVLRQYGPVDLSDIDEADATDLRRLAESEGMSVPAPGAA